MPQNDSGRDTSLSVGELFENHMSLLKKSVFPKNRGNREMENVWKSRENHLWGFLARPNFCEFLVSEFFNSLTCIPNTRNLSELSKPISSGIFRTRICPRATQRTPYVPGGDRAAERQPRAVHPICRFPSRGQLANISWPFVTLLTQRC
jgi:hypothetical protein